ncbi:serine hydrolase [Phenylobacterium aquaticum]|uniref:serine hydrolase domain-containing protein n=1 Tax=Phenylobacterium aquaticum TaxID=1763816 RepID=UPI0026EAA9E5|nr:serine hydrolase domain-containing protein [Phenylobacterium aquaticum]
MDRVLSAADPQSVGLSPAGLGATDQALAELIAQGELAGAVTLVARHGRIVHRSVQGVKDLASGAPLTQDTIFRIFSMTKPVTGVAMMILHDRGLWSPDDPIAKHLPEFEGVRVRTGEGTEPAAHAPTLRELLTHTAGFGYGFNPDDPTDAAYMAAGVWTSKSLAEFSRKIATAPLAYQPGSRWRYSLSMDLQGAIIEKLSGQSLPEFMQAHIFGPLGMVDTGFHVPAAKLPRLATLYRKSPKRQALTVVERPMGRGDPSLPPTLAGGGGGLFSTIDDYACFAQMLLNQGVYGGARILSPEAVALMTANHLSDALLGAGHGVGLQQIRPGYGHGFDGAVFHDPAAAGSRVGKGTYQWDGAAGTWFWVDPENDLLFIGLIQRMAEEGAPPLQATTQALIAAALS